MGYIFDALNKKRGDDELNPSEAAETPQADADEAITTPAIENTDQPVAEEQDDAPLRISDVQFEAETDNEEAGFIADALSPSDFDSEQANFISPAIADDLEAELADELEPVETTAEATESAEVEATTAEVPDADPGPVMIDAEERPPVKGFWNRLMGRHLRGKVDDRLVAMTSPASAMSEEYRSIRTSILARHENDRHLVHTITSATPQEGKTITCVNLGLSFAELRNRNTVIVECDLRLPTFAKLLNCRADKPGLIDYLRGEVSLKDIVQKTEGSPLHIIPAGGRVSDEAVQLLSSARMTRLIQALRAKYDHVIIDTPPVLQLADAGILGSQSEEVLLVARMRRTPRPLVEQATKTLQSYNAQVNGIIATDNPRSRGRGYGYKYGYGYRYAYGYSYTEESKSSRKKRKQRRAA